LRPDQRLAELDVVLAVDGRERHRQHARHRLDLDQRRRRGLAAGQRVAGLAPVSSLPSAMVSPASADARFAVMGAADAQNAGDAAALARR
jgi:hypothetical protein